MDSGYIMKVSQVVNEAIEYRNIIPDSLCAKNMVLQERAKRLLDAYNSYCDAYSARYQIYGGTPSAKAEARKREHLQKLMTGIPTAPNSSDNHRKHGLFTKIFG